jgi:hypothetical protein
MRTLRALLALGTSLFAASALSAVHPFASAFKTQFIVVDGATVAVIVDFLR